MCSLINGYKSTLWFSFLSYFSFSQSSKHILNLSTLPCPTTPQLKSKNYLFVKDPGLTVPCLPTSTSSLPVTHTKALEHCLGSFCQQTLKEEPIKIYDYPSYSSTKHMAQPCHEWYCSNRDPALPSGSSLAGVRHRHLKEQL